MDLPSDEHRSPGSEMNSKSLKLPIIPLSNDTRYQTQVWVSDKEPHEELHQYHSFQSKNIGVKPRAKTIVPHNRKTVDAFQSAIKRLPFREQRVLVQLWSPHDDGKYQSLTTKDQPFCFGVIDDVLLSYRKFSEHKTFVVDKDHQEYNSSPPARVFSQGIPEWISDINNYNQNDFPQQEYAIHCKFQGYLALPVFDSTTRLCVGVLEFLMSSPYMSFAYVVKQVHRELKKENLRSPKAFSFPDLMVSEEWENTDKIFKALQIVCRTHSLPLAQTWAASPSSSLVSHEQVIGKSCNSFDTRCIGKFCLSTAGLPFHVQDLGKWSFREASRKQHLQSPLGVIGRVFSTQGSCYCVDVTKLSAEDYPLVPYARISNLTCCFAIFLQTDNSNHRYVLEFFLPRHIKDGRYISSVLETLKENMVGSGFELGDKSSIQVVGPPTDLYVHKEPDIIQTSSNEMGDNFSYCMDSYCMDSSCSEQSVTSIAESNCANAVSTTDMSMENTCTYFDDDVENSNVLKEDRKRKRDLDIVPPVTRKVTVKATFNEIKEEFQFWIPSELSNLKNEVAKRFKLMENMIDLKYYDEENDLILVSLDEDVESALRASESDGTISLIVKIKV